MILRYHSICPGCGDNLHRSRRHGFKERVLFRIALIRPMRCHRCLDRFYCSPSVIFGGGSPLKAPIQEHPEETKELKRRKQSKQPD